MGQEAFYKQNRRDREEREILLSERLGEAGRECYWRIRPMTQRENEAIWKSCGKDEKRYEAAILAASVVCPDLKDAALQNSYGVIGAERLLERLLLPGEYDALRLAVEEINGGDAGCTGSI